MVLINVLWHTLAAHLMQFNVACCVIIGSDALCWSISSYLCLWVTGFYSAGFGVVWQDDVTIVFTSPGSGARRGATDWQSSQFIYLKPCVVWLSVSRRLLHSVATTEAVLGICVVGGEGEKKAAGTGIFTTLPSRRLYPRLLSSSGGIFFKKPVTLVIVHGHGRHAEETGQHILLQRLTGQAWELAQRLPCKFINKWWPT